MPTSSISQQTKSFLEKNRDRRGSLSKIGSTSKGVPKVKEGSVARRSRHIKEALQLRKLEPERLQRAPKITELIQSAAKGGLPEVLESLRFSSDPLVVQFLECYDRASLIDRRALPWEGFALEAGINPALLLGSIIIALQMASADKVRLLYITNHPDTVRARIKAAKTSMGKGDRDAIDQSLGLLPTPKPSAFIKNLIIEGHEKGSAEPEEVIDNLEDFVFPNLSDTQKMIRQLPEGAK